MAVVAIFDFLSHAHMHHPFNEGYLRTVRAAFPADRIVFHARQEHLDGLIARFSDSDGIEFHPCPAFVPAFGLSPHNPLAGRPGAWASWKVMRSRLAEITGGAAPRLVAVLGFDANLLGVLRWTWSGRAPLHLILHGQLGAAMRWRTRNPIFRSLDLIAGLQRPLPPTIRVVVLELGIDKAVARILPAIEPALRLLEHPVLESEWSPAQAQGDGVLRIGFLGYASRAKGFALFTELARRLRRPQMEFHAIGLTSPDSSGLDLSGLTTAPSPTPVPRPEYLRAIAALDAVCLPLSNSYDYVASGTVIDAIAASVPLLSIRNNSLTALEAAYGPIGELAGGVEDLASVVGALDPVSFAARSATWQTNLARIREARRPRALGPIYAASL